MVPEGMGAESKVMSVAEAALELHCSKNLLYELVRSGRVRSVRLGRKIIIPRSVIAELLAGDQLPGSQTTMDD